LETSKTFNGINIMLQAIEVIVEPSGAIRYLEEFHVATPTRAVLLPSHS
jgi:hypothetical protein